MTAIRWATAAAEDLGDIARHISQDSQEAARTFVERVDNAVRQLAEQPRSGRVVPELERQSVQRYREIVLSPWRLFYRFEENTVVILAIIDGRRNIQDILLRRLTRS